MKAKLLIIGLFVMLFLLSGCAEISTFYYSFEPYPSGYNPFKHRCLEVFPNDYEDSLGTAVFHTWKEAEEEVRYLYSGNPPFPKENYWTAYTPRGSITDWCKKENGIIECDFLVYTHISPTLWTVKTLELAKENDKFLALDCARYDKR